MSQNTTATTATTANNKVSDIRLRMLYKQGCSVCQTPFVGGDYYEYSKGARVHFVCDDCQSNLVQIGIIPEEGSSGLAYHLFNLGKIFAAFYLAMKLSQFSL